MSTTPKERTSLVVGTVKWVLIAVVVLVLAGVGFSALADAATDADEPVEPVDGVVLERYELRNPETVATSCVYDERLGEGTGELYRLCFDDDVLIGKTIVFPEAVDEP